KPRRPKPRHRLIVCWKILSRRFEINQISLERAIHSPPANLPHDLAVIDAARTCIRIFRFNSQSSLQTVAKIFYAQKLHRPIVSIAYQINDPLRRRSAKKFLEVAGGIKSENLIEHDGMRFFNDRGWFLRSSRWRRTNRAA